MASVVSVAIFLLIVLGFASTYRVRWIGGYIVHVKTNRTGDRPIREAAHTAILRTHWKAIQEHGGYHPEENELFWEPVTITDGGSFIARVKTVGESSGLGLRDSRSRYEVLLVKVVYADGGSHLVIADIPEKRGGPDPGLTVEVP